MSDAQQPLSILITDDDASNRSFIATILKSLVPNPDICEAPDGESALILMNKKINQCGSSFDLIFMDFKMPGMNGEETTKQIREIEEQASIAKKSVIITWSSVKNSAYPLADDWLPKPPLKQEVADILSSYGFTSIC